MFRRKLKLTDLEIIKPIKNPSVLLVKGSINDGEPCCLKLNTSETDVRLHQFVFPKIDQSGFKRLALPTFISSGQVLSNWGWWLITKYIEGEVVGWDEFSDKHAGGKSFDTAYIKAYVEVLEDLGTVDESVVEEVLPAENKHYSVENMEKRLDEIIEFKLISKGQKQRALSYLRENASLLNDSKQILSNVDLHARNLIAQPDGKLALTDWTLSRGFEPVEFSVAYQWILMWKNPQEQRRLAELSIETFGTGREQLNYAIVVRSINQIHTWRRHHSLAEQQLEYLLNGISGKALP